MINLKLYYIYSKNGEQISLWKKPTVFVLFCVFGANKFESFVLKQQRTKGNFPQTSLEGRNA